MPHSFPKRKTLSEKPTEWRSVGYWSKSLSPTEQNYSATERECYSVVWAITTLRPYLEGQKFTVRSDHDALRWLITLTDPSGRLMRWRLRLSEFDFEIQYRPGRVHQVPDALSRLISPNSIANTKPEYDEVPTFGDHFDPFLVTTRSRTTTKSAKSPAPPVDEHDQPPDDQDEILDDTLDEALDLFDLDIACSPPATIAIDPADVPMKITIPEILEAQRTDSFCQTVLARQSRKLDTLFSEDDDGFLRRQHPRHPEIKQIVLPGSLRPRVLQLAHHSPLAGHPGQTRLYSRPTELLLAAHGCRYPRDRAQLCHVCQEHAQVTQTHESSQVIPGHATFHVLVYRYSRPTHEDQERLPFLVGHHGPLHETHASHSLEEDFILQRGRSFRGTLGLQVWTSTYCDLGQRQAIRGQVFPSRVQITWYLERVHEYLPSPDEWSSREIQSHDSCNDQDDWDRYATVLTYAYNNHVHRTTGTTPFDLVLSRPPPAFSLYHSPTSRQAPTEQREDYLERLDATLEKGYHTLLKTQARYKKDFDKRVRVANRNIRAGQYIYLDPTDGTTKGTKLGNHALGPYRVFKNDKRTFVIQRGDEVERVNADRITFAPPPAAARPPEPLAATEQDLKDKIREGPVYVFDKIRNHRTTSDGKLEFLIKWHGYTKPTWRPRTDSPEEAISKYLSQRRRSARLHE